MSRGANRGYRDRRIGIDIPGADWYNHTDGDNGTIRESIMPISKTEKETAQFLQDVVSQYDLDWIVYQLVEGAVKKRNEVDEGDNDAEKDYWQEAVIMLNKFQSQLENI